jgi:Spy/CpxP family protein refolding chaperone
MKTSMQRLVVLSALAAAMAGASTWASADDQATMPYPGMMRQYQGGQGQAGTPGYGPGMMGGYGMGPGMMGGYGGGYGMGPGMMGGYGPGYGMGPGMMGGWGGGYGMGPGMMGYGMVPWMMGGYGGGHGMGPWGMLNLSDAQTSQLEKIQTELMQKERTLMGKMWEEQNKLADLYNTEKRDPAAIGKAYSKLADLQRQALEARVDAENKVLGVLTKEQKEQMRRGFGWGMMGY